MSGNDGVRPTRKGGRHLRVPVLPEEEAAIKQNASGTGMSIAAYLRNVGMGMPVRSTLDHDLILKLAKVNGDQGRLGGLLKLWLTNSEKLQIDGDEVRLRGVILGLLDRIATAQIALLRVLDEIEKKL